MFNISNTYKTCANPIYADTYIGCDGYCAYCYIKNRPGSKGVKSLLPPRPVEHVTNGKYLKTAKVLHLGVTADPLPAIENTFHATENFIKKYAPTHFIVMTSKMNFAKFPGVLAAIAANHGRVACQFSMVSDDSKRMAILDEGLPSFDERIESIEAFTSVGGIAQVRMSPYIPPMWSNDLTPFFTRIKKAGASSVLIQYMFMDGVKIDQTRLIVAFKKFALNHFMLIPARTDRLSFFIKMQKQAHECGLYAMNHDTFNAMSDSPYCCPLEWFGLKDGDVCTIDPQVHAWHAQEFDLKVKGILSGQPMSLCRDACGQGTGARLKRLGLSIEENVENEFYLNPKKMNPMMPYAQRIASLKWKQTDQFWDMCLKNRIPFGKL